MPDRFHCGYGRVIGALLTFLIVLTPPLVAAGGLSPMTPRLAAAQAPPAGPVIVLLQPNTNAAQLAALARIQPNFVYANVFSGFAATLPAAAIEVLLRNPRVLSISEDVPVQAAEQIVPAGIRRIGATSHPGAAIDGVDSRVDADIAVLDSGIDPTQPDLNVIGGYDCILDDNVDSYDDNYGHGTHVAGVAAAIDNGSGVVGVAPGARLWAVKVLDSGGRGTLSEVICGLDWVAGQAGTIDVVNLSLTGGGVDGPCADNAFHQAICNVVGAGVPVVVAAGNQGIDAAGTIPATYDEVIAASWFSDFDGAPGGLGSQPTGCSTSSSVDDAFAAMTNYGPDIDIAAPGTCVLSTERGGGVGYRSGTSMAAPHVAGAVALIRAANPGASPAAVRASLLGMARSQEAAGVTGGRAGSTEPVLTLGVTGGAATTTPSPAATATGTTAPSPTATVASTATATLRPATATATSTATPLPPTATRTPAPTPVATQPGATATVGPGAALPIVAGGQASGAIVAARAYDGSLSTTWYHRASPAPAESFVSFDLGSVRPIGEIRWVYRITGAADAFAIQVSADGVSWTTLANRGNSAASVWQSLAVATSGRYVRFYYTNPGRDTTLGYLAEIAIHGPGASVPATATAPLPTATKTTVPPTATSIPPTSSATSTRVPATATPPPVTATTAATATTVPPTSTRTPLPPTATPTRTPIPATSTSTIAPATATAANTSTPTTGGAATRLAIVGTGQAAGALLGSRAVDGSTSTSWYHSASPAPAGSFVSFDLGSVRPIGEIRWVYRISGYADAFAIQVSADGVGWTTLANRGNSASLAWQSLAVATNGRYVRFFYTNPGGDTTLGYLAEVEIWGPAAVAAASVDEPTASPTFAPTSTFAPSPTESPAPSATLAPDVVVSGSGVVGGTGGDDARCRAAASTDAEILTMLPEGTTVSLTGPLVGEWQPVLCGGQAGYVHRDFIGAPGQESVPTEEMALPTSMPTLEPTETPYAIVDSGWSDNATTSLTIYDGDLTTTWGTETTAPPDLAFVWFDLGWVQPVEKVRWRAGPDVMATSLIIELSEDGVQWARLSEVDLTWVQGDAWYEQPVDVEVRFVRLSLPNPTGLPRLGGIAEVELWPAISARPFAAIVTPEPPPAVEVYAEPIATEPVLVPVEASPEA